MTALRHRIYEDVLKMLLETLSCPIAADVWPGVCWEIGRQLYRDVVQIVDVCGNYIYVPKNMRNGRPTLMGLPVGLVPGGRIKLMIPFAVGSYGRPEEAGDESLTPDTTPAVESFRFDGGELAWSEKADLARGKVYRAGTAFGIEAGMVEETDMATGETRLLRASSPGSGLPEGYGGHEASPFVVLGGDGS